MCSLKKKNVVHFTVNNLNGINLILFDHASLITTGKEESQFDATITVYWQIQISSTCFRQQFCPSSGALDCTLQLAVCCTQYIASWWSGDGDHQVTDKSSVCCTQYIVGRWSGDGDHQITDQQRIGYNIPQAVVYSLMLLRMARIIAQNMLS